MSTKHLMLLLTIVMLSFSSAVAARSPVAPGLDLQPTGVLRAGDGAARHDFGMDIALQENTAVIGAPGWNNEHGDYTGAVYIFSHNGLAWEEITQLMASDARAYETFGVSVDLEGDTLVVGASAAQLGQPGDPNFTPNAGAVYVFTGSGATWTEQARLQPAELVEFNDFGLALDLDEATLFVGAPEYGGNYTEAVYAYHHTGGVWNAPQKLSGPDPSGNHQFGAAVAVAGDIALVGAPGINCCDQFSAFEKGVVYVFTRSGEQWSAAGLLTPDDGFPGDNFGCDIAFDGTTAVIAACQAYGLPQGANRGYAYVFTHDGSTWTQSARLEPEGDVFFPQGISSVLLDGDRLLLATTSRPGGPWPGRVYPYRLEAGTWTAETPIDPPDGHPQTAFGEALALNDQHLLVGDSDLSLDDAGRQGGVYTFDKPLELNHSVYVPVIARPAE
ncbi:MAG: FG-GAP repeat protein [Candidatus Promineofilum sp.]|nr:FG-GAP repeat protein [Promineifilum sp.]